MKPYVVISTVIVLAYCAIGCDSVTGEEVSKIHIDPSQASESIKLSDLVDSLYYVKLENGEEALMGRVIEVILRPKYIYAIDAAQRAVLVFDWEGRFVAKLDKSGDGPDEYNRMEGVWVDDEETYIDILDFRGDKSRIISYSNISFEKTGEAPFPSPPLAFSRIKKGDIHYFNTNQQENYLDDKTTNADIIAIKDRTEKKSLFDKKITIDGGAFSAYAESFVKNEDGEVYASLLYHNKFYQLSGMDARPVIDIDFGKKGIDLGISKKNTTEQLRYLNNETKGLGYFPSLSVNNSSMLLFSYYNSQFENRSLENVHYYIYLKNKGSTYHVKTIKNDLTEFPAFVNPSYFLTISHPIYYNEHLVELVLPGYHLHGQSIDVPGIGVVYPEDNPIIVMMRLRKDIFGTVP